MCEETFIREGALRDPEHTSHVEIYMNVTCVRIVQEEWTSFMTTLSVNTEIKELSEEYVLMWNVQQWLDKQKKSWNPHERNTVATNINVTCVKISQQAWSSFMATLKGNIAIT